MLPPQDMHLVLKEVCLLVQHHLLQEAVVKINAAEKNDPLVEVFHQELDMLVHVALPYTIQMLM